MFRARFTFKTAALPEDLMFMLYDPTYRLSWDKSNLVAFEDIARPEEGVAHYYIRNKAPWPFQDRDFVEKRIQRKLETGEV